MTRKRHELKYMISELDYFVLIKRLERVLQKDQNSNGKSYSITSLYFDDYNNQAYKEKINGEAYRHKYRIRYYNDDFTYIKLEKKSKINQMTLKAAEPLSIEEVERIYEGDTEFLLAKEGDLYHEFYGQLNHRLLKPKVIVKYEREAFTHPIGDLRVTFDRNICTANYQTKIFDKDINYTPAVDPQQIILEVKFDGILPDHIKNLIQTGHVMQASSSKYVYARKNNSFC